MATHKRLYRLREDRIVAGVCSGLGEYFSIDPVIFRLGFVLITLGWFSGVFLYLVMWLIIPLKPQE